MKGILLLCFLFASFLNQDLAEIRKIYPNAAKTETNAKELAARLSNVTETGDKTLVAYKGASITLVSKFLHKLGEKMHKFKEGAQLIELAVNVDPNNIEIRFIRLSVQENVPGITNYKKNIREDAAFLLAHYKEQSGTLKEYLKTFMLQSKSFTASEKQTLK